MDFRIPILLSLLSNPNYHTRENAATALQHINPPILFLEIMEQDKNLETARRIQKLANRWYDQNAETIASYMQSTKYPRMPMIYTLIPGHGFIGWNNEIQFDHYIGLASNLFHAEDQTITCRNATMLYVADLIRCRTPQKTIQTMLDNMAANEIETLRNYVNPSLITHSVPFAPPKRIK